ncbi:MAG: pentapeptide repeat-containing protein [Cyanobacteriota bacterium]
MSRVPTPRPLASHRPWTGLVHRWWTPLLRWSALMLLVLAPWLAPAPAMASFAERVDYTLTNQSGQDFHGQDLRDTSFAGAVARQANFDAADLRGAIFTQGAFAEASFRGANLSDVLMDRVDFKGADFSGALLEGVIASGSSFAGATVTDADFSGAILDRADQVALCRQAKGRHPVTGVDTRASLGC